MLVLIQVVAYKLTRSLRTFQISTIETNLAYLPAQCTINLTSNIRRKSRVSSLHR